MKAEVKTHNIYIYIYTFIYFLWVSLVHLQQSHLSSNANAPRMLIKYQQPFRIIAGVMRICTITPQVWLVAHYIPSTQFFPPRQIHDEKTKKFLSLHHRHHQPRPQSSIRKWEKHKTYTELQLAQNFVSTVSDAKKCWEREREIVTVAWHWQVHVMQHGYPLEMKETRLPDPPLSGEVLESTQPRHNHQVYNTLFKQSLSQLPKSHFFFSY